MDALINSLPLVQILSGAIIAVLAWQWRIAIKWNQISTSIEQLTAAVAKVQESSEIALAAIRKIDTHGTEIASLWMELGAIKGQMIGWDLLKRIEGQLSLFAVTGQGNDAMSLVAKVIANELEARGKK